MKLSNLLAIGIITVYVVGCALPPPTIGPGPRPPVASSSPSANFLIISAVYGSGTNFADVTYRVDDLLHQPDVEFFARPEWVHADPTPGWNKALVIVYEFKGWRHIFTTGEGGKVSLEQLIEQAKKKPKKHAEHRA
jgi:hypothetical protein